MTQIIILGCVVAMLRAVAGQYAGEGMMGPPDSQYVQGCPGGQWQFMCDNGECIAQYDLCDKIVQCSDGSDESAKNCGQRGPPKLFSARPPSNNVQSPMKNARTLVPTTTPGPTTPQASTTSYDHKALKWLLLGVSGTLGVFAVLVVLRRRCKKSAPGAAFIRRGEKFGNEEDDLLISSMYS